MRRERDQVRSSDREISVRQHCCCVLNYHASTTTAHHHTTYNPSRRGGAHSQPPHAPRAPRAAPTPTPTPAPRGAASVSVSVRFCAGTELTSSLLPVWAGAVTEHFAHAARTHSPAARTASASAGELLLLPSALPSLQRRPPPATAVLSPASAGCGLLLRQITRAPATPSPLSCLPARQRRARR